MQKLASEFTNTVIITKEEHAILGSLENIIINPETGSAIGISFLVPGRKNKIMVANTSDIAGVGTNFIMLESAGNASEPDEIIRIKDVLDLEISIIGSYVFDEDERYLGKVRDFSINFKAMNLERLYVTSSGLVKFITQDLMIPANNIIKIEKNKITVRSGSVKSGGKFARLVKTEEPIQANPSNIKSLSQKPKN